ncbi:MAG: OadG family protein [Lachnospiraceae bacterium]|nr:OadG family protein [Lachnospiraceae bacterium]
MKKWLLVLGMITCMLGLTACGGQKESVSFLTNEQAAEYATVNIETINQVVAMGQQAQLAEDWQIAAVESWEAALEDMGDYQSIVSVEASVDEEDGVINATIQGSKRQAIVEFVVEDQAVTAITTNVVYSFGEKMEKAALNTLLGMGTVFVVLILISLIIGCFGFIPKIQAMFNKKSKEEEKAEAVDNTIAQIIEKEELSDDLELVAVIAAAIAASEGAASTDGFVVRSIKRAGNKWQRA